VKREAMKDKISLITVTYDRESLLLRCMESVAQQDYDGPMEHVIVGDGSAYLKLQESRFKAYYRDRSREIDVIVLHRGRDTERYLWERIASHQNAAVAASSGDCIVILDDDNTIACNHISSLWTKLAEGYDAVHSWRYVFYQDGRPCPMHSYPWATDDPLRERIMFKTFCDAGVYVPGQNIIRDTLDLPFKGRIECGAVDSGEWMFRKHLFTTGKLQFKDDYPFEGIMYGYFDDYLLNKRIIELDLKVGCTDMPTLNYYLSGASQKPEGTQS
jgi:glycosyltransferase involved in cell wall biosynthesis